MADALRVEDWRPAPEAVMRALYDAETERWSRTLEWDTAMNWDEIERGRRFGTVRGVLVKDPAGRVAGWSFYLLHDGVLQVGGFQSTSDACSRLMLDVVLAPWLAGEAQTVTFFAFTDVEGLAVSLRQPGLSVGRYWYMLRELPVGGRSVSLRETRTWRIEDAPATAELLRRAYGPSDGSRPFAPRSTADEWQHYVAQLAASHGCGTLLLPASLCVPAGPGRLAAVALVSEISAGTGHLVQLAVDPSFRRRGYAASLLRGACEAATRVGYRRMTLFVEGRNAGARSLYDALGFTIVGSFVAAGAAQPRRSTSVAAGMGATTFR